MNPGLRLSIVQTDEDYFGTKVAAATSRFAGTTFIYGALDELTTFFKRIKSRGCWIIPGSV